MQAVHLNIHAYTCLVLRACILPDEKFYFALVRGCLRAGKVAPDEILYNSLLEGCAKQHRVDEALRLLGDMRTSRAALSTLL